MSYAEYLASPEWKARRAAALKRAGHRCQLCAYSGRNLDVHHNNYNAIGNEAPGDLVVLCKLCHARHHMNRRPKERAPQASALENLRRIYSARERKDVA